MSLFLSLLSMFMFCNWFRLSPLCFERFSGFPVYHARTHTQPFRPLAPSLQLKAIPCLEEGVFTTCIYYHRCLLFTLVSLCPSHLRATVCLQAYAVSLFLVSMSIL
jgi:hypothetical protein